MPLLSALKHNLAFHTQMSLIKPMNSDNISDELFLPQTKSFSVFLFRRNNPGGWMPSFNRTHFRRKANLSRLWFWLLHQITSDNCKRPISIADIYHKCSLHAGQVNVLILLQLCFWGAKNALCFFNNDRLNISCRGEL